MMNFRPLAYRSRTAILVFVGILALSTPVCAQSPPEVLLQQLVGQLQSDPGDTDLRQKIIQLAREISPGPVIPEEANRNFIKGNVYLKEAKDPAGYQLAISSYQNTLLLTPWWGDAYYNLSVAHESAGNFNEAIDAIKLYMSSVAKDGGEFREAQNKIYILEAKAELNAIESSSVAAEKPPAPGTEGKWDMLGMLAFEVVKSGDTYRLTSESMYGRPGLWYASNIFIDRDRLQFTVEQPTCASCRASYDLMLSADGNHLTGTMTRLDGSREPAADFRRAP